MNRKNLFENGKDCDISFTINGKKFGLHKNIIGKKSLFFKALLDNQIHMGIKEDEIEIRDMIDSTLINCDYIHDILIWLYDNNLNTMKMTNCNMDDYIVKIFQYITISDFFQIDELKVALLSDLPDIMSVNNNEKRYIEEHDMLQKENFALILSKYNCENFDICPMENNLMRYSYRDHYIKLSNHILDEFEYIQNYVYDKNSRGSWKKISDSPPSNFLDIINKIYTQSKHNNPLKKLLINGKMMCFDTVTMSYVPNHCFVEYILEIYHKIYFDYSDTQSYWMPHNVNIGLPLCMVDILLRIAPGNDNSVRVLDTSDWIIDNNINWYSILQFEKICMEHERPDIFRKKLKAFMDINYHK